MRPQRATATQTHSHAAPFAAPSRMCRGVLGRVCTCHRESARPRRGTASIAYAVEERDRMDGRRQSTSTSPECRGQRRRCLEKQRSGSFHGWQDPPRAAARVWSHGERITNVSESTACVKPRRRSDEARRSGAGQAALWIEVSIAWIISRFKEFTGFFAMRTIANPSCFVTSTCEAPSCAPAVAKTHHQITALHRALVPTHQPSGRRRETAQRPARRVSQHHARRPDQHLRI